MSNKRTLITGQRYGGLLVLNEIEKRATHGGYDVIVFCFECGEAKRLPKARLSGKACITNCGCVHKRQPAQVYRELARTGQI